MLARQVRTAEVRSRWRALLAIGLAAAFGFVVWYSVSQRYEPSAADPVVPVSDTDTWTAHLARGREVEFREDPRPGRSSADTVASRSKVGSAQAIGKLTAAQKQTVIERMTTFLVGSEERYRDLPVSSPEEQIESLQEAYSLVMKEAALTMVKEDRAWFFRHGDPAFRVAWRNVPRGWQKMQTHNVATTDDGTPIDMIVAVDPADDPALASVLEQLHGAESQRVAALADEFNALPEATRRARIERHLAASELRESGKPFNDGDLLDSSLRVQREALVVYPRW